MPLHERSRIGDRLRFRFSDCAQIEQVTRLGPMAAMPHLLRDDFGAGLDPELASLVGHELEGLLRQRGADDDVDLSVRQEKLDEFSGRAVSRLPAPTGREGSFP